MVAQLDIPASARDTSASALAALAEDAHATWLIWSGGPRPDVVGAGAEALLTSTLGGAAWQWLEDTLRDTSRRVVTLAPGLIAEISPLAPAPGALVRLMSVPNAAQSVDAELTRLTRRMSGDTWVIVGEDDRIIQFNTAERPAVPCVEGPIGMIVWELVPAIGEARWREWLAALAERPRMWRSVETARGDQPSRRVQVELIRDELEGRPVVLMSTRELGLSTERELRERRAAEELRAAASAALARCSDDELDAAVPQVLSVLGVHLGARELRVLRGQPSGAVVGLWSWGEPDDRVPMVSARPPTQGLETVRFGEAVRICAVISDGGSTRGYLKALWPNEASFARRPITTEPLLTSTAELLGRAFARIDSAESSRRGAKGFQDFINNLPGLAFRTDMGDAYRFCMVSEGSRTLLGRAPDELLGRSFLELVHPDDLDRVLASCVEQARVGDRFDLEYRVVTADGRERWVWSVGHKVYDRDGVILYSEGLLTDITERRQAERERDLFFTSSQDAMAILNGSGRIKRGNPAFWTLFGVKDTPESTATVRVSQSDDPEKSLQIIEAALAQLVEAPYFEGIEGRYLTKAGHERWISWSGVVVREPVIRIYIVGHDITRRHVEEEERRALRERLAQVQRLESLGILAGGLAHDLNNVICVALGSLSLINAGPGQSAERSRHISRVEGALERGSRIIDQLLSFGRRQVSQRTPTELNLLVCECVALARGSTPADVQIKVEPRAAALAWADAAQIEQVVMNLIMNALDALPQGGTVCVSTEDVQLRPEDGVQYGLGAGSYVMIRVEDDGVGIDEKLREQIFDPFFTTKASGKGLGLSSAYGIVRAHDGALRARAALRRGSVFEVLLPVSVGELISAQGRAPVAAAPPRSGQGGTVLIVEDNLDLQETIALVLESVGYRVRLASDAAEAKGILSEGPVDLLLTDVVMPGESGVSLASYAQRLYSAQRTVFMSGYAWNELVRSRSMPPGAIFLRKPFTNETLTRVVADALAVSQSGAAPG